VRWAFWTWVAVAVVADAVAFFALPAWDTDSSGWISISGTEAFVMLTLMILVGWAVGLLFIIVPVVLCCEWVGRHWTSRTRLRGLGLRHSGKRSG
jgi:hypothetical protein